MKRKLLLPDKSETNFEVIRYLTSRGIDSDVIKACIDEGLLYESLPYHNCIFVGFDETGNAAYAFYLIRDIHSESIVPAAHFMYSRVP